MSIIRRVANGASAFVIACSSLMTLAFPLTAHAAGQTCTWTGAGSDKNFSTALNWSGCAGAPTDNDSLVFNGASTADVVTVTNDINGLIVDGITFTTSPGRKYVIAGDLTLNGDIVADASPDFTGALTLAKNITVSGSVTFTDTGSLDLAAYNLAITSGFVYFNGDITGSGAFNFSTSATVALFTGNATAFTGSVHVLGGAGVDLAPDSLGASASLTIASGGTLSFCTFNGASFAAPITVGGDGSGNPSIYTNPVCGGGAGGDTLGVNAQASVILTGALTLTSNTVIGGAGDFKVTGPLSGAFTLTQQAGTNGKVTIASSSNTSSTPNGTQVSQFLSTSYAENQPTVTINANPNQEAILTGTYLNAYVNGGLLKGTGTIKDTLMVYSTGKVAPGMSPGCITSDILDLAGTYLVDLGGADPCTGYDQLKVLNASNTVDAVKLDNTTAVVTTSLYNNYVPKKGQVFIIVDQGGDKAVTGTFKDLPEGATFTQNGVVFKISYVGGTGNDVTLTVQNSPGVPDTGFSFVSAQPAIILAIMTVLSGAIVFTARRMNAFSTKK